MTVRAYVSSGDMLSRNVNIGFIAQGTMPGDPIFAIKPALGPHESSMREIRPEEEFPVGYVLRLTDAQARALLEELLRHYQGNDDTRALRADYDHERKRVDKMIDALIGVAK